MEQRTVTIKNFLRITKIVQVSAMKVHFQIAERSLFYLNPDIHYRRMTYPLERDYCQQYMINFLLDSRLYVIFPNVIIKCAC